MDGWAIIINLLYAVVIALFVVLIYLIVRNRELLYKQFNFSKYLDKIVPRKQNYIDNDNAIQLIAASKLVQIEIDEEGKIISEAYDVAAYLAFLLSNEHNENNLGLIVDYFENLTAGTENYEACYFLLPSFLDKKDFIKSNNLYNYYERLITAICNFIKTDKNTRDFYTILAYIVSYEFKVENLDLSNEFIEASEAMSKVTIFDAASYSTNNILNGFYKNGNLAISDQDEFGVFARYIPALFFIYKYKNQFNSADFDAIVPAHKIIGTTWRKSMQVDSGVYDPVLSDPSQLTGWASVNLAFMVHTMYDVFTMTELTTMLEKQRFTKRYAIFTADVIVPDQIPYRQVNYEPTSFLNLDKKYMRLEQTGFAISMSVPPPGNSNSDSLSVAFDFPNPGDLLYKHALGNPFLYMKTEAGNWQADVNLIMTEIDGMNVGMRKTGSDVRALGAQDLYFVAERNAASFLNLFSDLSYDPGSGNKPAYSLMSIASETTPELVSSGDKLRRVTDTSYEVAAGAVFAISTSYYKQRQDLAIYCSETVSINITFNAGYYYADLTCSSTSKLATRYETSDVVYQYVAFSVATCSYIPAMLPKLYVQQFELDKNVIRYNDFMGANRANLLVGSLNSSIFENLSLQPVVSLEQRQRILIIDNINLSNTGMAIFDPNEVPLTIFQNREVRQQDNGLSLATGFSLRMVK